MCSELTWCYPETLHVHQPVQCCSAAPGHNPGAILISDIFLEGFQFKSCILREISQPANNGGIYMLYGGRGPWTPPYPSAYKVCSPLPHHLHPKLTVILLRLQRTASDCRCQASLSSLISTLHTSSNSMSLVSRRPWSEPRLPWSSSLPLAGPGTQQVNCP